jgi:hypothetical protein
MGLYSSSFKQLIQSGGRRAGKSPSVDAFIQAHGNENINSFTILRTVLNPFLTGAIGVISPFFRRKTEDTKLYHLHVLIRTTKSSFALEKNARIAISSYQKKNGSEDMPVSIPPGLTLKICCFPEHALLWGTGFYRIQLVTITAVIS